MVKSEGFIGVGGNRFHGRSGAVDSRLTSKMSGLELLIFVLLCLALTWTVITLLSTLHRRGVQLERLRFSLRTLLVGMTAIAVLLGAVIFAVK